MTINEILDGMRCYNKETMNNLNNNLIAKTIFRHLCANDSMRYVEILKKKFLKAELIHYNYWHNSCILKRRTTLYKRQDRT